MSFGTILFGSPLPLNNLHPDTIAYKNRIIANGGTISVADLKAIDVFVKGINKNNLKSLLPEIYPFAGNNFNAAVVKLYGNTDTLTNVNFIESDYVREVGFVSNGTKYFNSRVIASSIFSPSNGGFTVYNRLNNASSFDMGARNSSLGRFSYVSFGIVVSQIKCVYFFCNDSGASYNQPFPNILGTTTVVRRTNDDLRFFYKGQQVNSSLSSVNVKTGPDLDIFVFGVNIDGNNNSTGIKNYGFVSIHNGLTPSQVLIFSNLIDNLMLAFGRNV